MSARPILPLDALLRLQSRPTPSTLAAARRSLPTAVEGSSIADRLARAIAHYAPGPLMAESAATLAQAALDALPSLSAPGVHSTAERRHGAYLGPREPRETIALGSVLRDLEGIVTRPSSWTPARVAGVARAAGRVADDGEGQRAALALARWAEGREEADAEQAGRALLARLDAAPMPAEPSRYTGR